MNSTALALVTILLALIHGCHGQHCARTIPFSKEVVGKTFSWSDDCYRPSAGNTLSVFAKMTILKLNDGFRFFNCPESYLIRYRTPKVTPMIIKYPAMEVEFSEGSWDTERNNAWCAQNQEKNKIEMFPVDETRSNFTKTVKYIMPYLREIRDFGCELDEDGFWTQIKGRAYVNADVQHIMTYLDNIAFQYSLCI